MAQAFFCYRLNRNVPLLTETEWEQVGNLLFGKDRMRSVMGYKRDTGCSLDEAWEREPVGQNALALYEALTGVRLCHPFDLYHIKASTYGSQCPTCKKPFRTPRAKLCAECGYQLPTGQLAGPLEI